MTNAKFDIERQNLQQFKDCSLALITNIPKSTMKELNKMQKEFIWKNKNPKIKHITICNNYDKSGLKNVVIS